MMLVTKRNRLLSNQIDRCDIRGAVDFRNQPQNQRDEEYRAEDTDPRDCIGTAVKNLRHRRATRAAAGLHRESDEQVQCPFSLGQKLQPF
jgi:hypothetical protein